MTDRSLPGYPSLSMPGRVQLAILQALQERLSHLEGLQFETASAIELASLSMELKDRQLVLQDMQSLSTRILALSSVCNASAEYLRTTLTIEPQNTPLPLLREAAATNARISHSLRQSLDLCAAASKSYLGRNAIEVAMFARAVAVPMLRLNTIYVMALPLIILEGLFTLNLKVPGESTTSLHWFWGIITVCVTITLIELLLIFRLGWLNSH
jgi:Mg2+ and Co2+ transporter CorA